MATTFIKLPVVQQFEAGTDSVSVIWDAVKDADCPAGFRVAGYKVSIAVAGFRWGAEVPVATSGARQSSASAAQPSDLIHKDTRVRIAPLEAGAYGVRVAVVYEDAATKALRDGPQSDFQASPYIRTADAAWAPVWKLQYEASEKLRREVEAARAYAARIKQLEDEKRSLKQTIAEREEKIRSLSAIHSDKGTAEKALASDDLLKMTQKKDIINEELRKLRADKSAVEEQVAEAKRQLTAAQASVTAQLSESAAALRAAQEKESEAAHRLSEVQMQLAEASSTKQRLDQQVEQVRNELNALEEGRKNADRDGALQAQFAALVSAKQTMQDQMDALMSQQVSVKAELDAANETVAILRKDLAAAQEDAKQARVEAGTLSANIAELKATIASGKEALEASQRTVAQLNRDFDGTVAQLRELQEAQIALSDQLSDSRSENKGLRADMQLLEALRDEQLRAATELAAQAADIAYSREAAEASATALQAEVTRLTALVAQLQHAAAAHEAKEQELTHALGVATAKNQSADESAAVLAGLKAQIQALSESSASQNQLAAQAAESASALTRLQQDLAAEKERSEALTTSFAVERASLNATITELNRAVDVAEQTVAELRVRLQKAEAEARQTTGTADRRLKEANELRDRYTEELKTAHAAVAAAEKREREAQVETRQAKQALEDTIRELKKLDETASGKVGELMAELDRAHSTCTTHIADLSQQEATINLLRVQHRQLEAENASLRHALGMARHGLNPFGQPGAATGTGTATGGAGNGTATTGGSGSFAASEGSPLSEETLVWLGSHFPSSSHRTVTLQLRRLLAMGFSEPRVRQAFDHNKGLTNEDNQARATWLVETAPADE
jgi:colicin import membrane protein